MPDRPWAINEVGASVFEGKGRVRKGMGKHFLLKLSNMEVLATREEKKRADGSNFLNSMTPFHI